MIDLFCIFFILAGLISILSPVKHLYELISTPYHIQAVSNVLSVRIEEIKTNRNDLNHISSKGILWITEEEIDVDGQKIKYEGKYAEDPGGEVAHTLISKDGTQWQVNDTDVYSLITGIAAGSICIIAGVSIIYIRKR